RSAGSPCREYCRTAPEPNTRSMCAPGSQAGGSEPSAAVRRSVITHGVSLWTCSTTMDLPSSVVAAFLTGLCRTVPQGLAKDRIAAISSIEHNTGDRIASGTPSSETSNGPETVWAWAVSRALSTAGWVRVKANTNTMRLNTSLMITHQCLNNPHGV